MRKRYKIIDGIYSFKAEDDWGDYSNGVKRISKRNKDGYAVHRYKCEDGLSHKRFEHVVKWEYFNGEIPDGYEIDHIIPISNGGTNKLSNLRLVTPKENSNNPLTLINASKARKGKKLSEEHKKKISEGNKGKTLSDETKAKLSKALKGLLAGEKHPMWGKKGKDNPLYGKPLSEEHKKKISESNKGKKMSEETKAKLKGRKLSEEHKAKLAAAKIGKIGKHRKEVVQLTLNGDFIAEYQSGTIQGFCQSAISACCSGKQKWHKGFKWMFKSDYEKMLAENNC